MKSRVSYAFHVQLVGFPGVERRIEVRGDQTLLDLHRAIFDSFGWWEEHLFAFWLSGEFWGEREYTHPFALEFNPMAPYSEGSGAKSADVRIDRLKLKNGQPIAYVHDFGDDWRAELELIEICPADRDQYPCIVERKGEAPPQYPEFDDEAAA